jgi:hypothetical protein
MTPKEIENVRRSMFHTRYKKAPSQRIFSLFLGFGSATIARYEIGLNRPQRAHEIILRKLSIDPGFISDISKWNRVGGFEMTDTQSKMQKWLLDGRFDIVPNWEEFEKQQQQKTVLKLQEIIFPA